MQSVSEGLAGRAAVVPGWQTWDLDSVTTADHPRQG